MSIPSVCMSGALEGAPDIHTDGTDIQPQTAQFYNECKLTDPRLVTWRSAVYEPPEDGFMRNRNGHYKIVRCVAVCLFRLRVCQGHLKVHLTYTQMEPTCGHKPHDFITNANQRIPS